MKKFIYKILFFLVTPLLIVFIIMEVILHNTINTFNQKAKYIYDNSEDIEILFLGSSHTQDGINPAFMDLNTANLGYGSQDYQLDLALLKSFIDRLPKLKYIVEEVDFIDLYKQRDLTYFRYPWYEKYYGFKIGSYPKYKKWSLYLSNPDFFNNYLKSYLIYENSINQFGYDDREVQGEFFRLGYNESKILNDVVELPELQSLFENRKVLKENMKRLKLIDSIAKAHGITFIQVSYPMHSSYYKSIESYPTYDVWKKYVSNQKSSGRLFWEFERDEMFKVTDFANPSHLNNMGAKKLTKMINDSIYKLDSEDN